MTRRTHSSLDNLPAGLQEALQRMLIDNEWPQDFPTKHTGKPKYKDLVKYCAHRGYSVSLAAVGRFGIRCRTLARMKQAGEVARAAMEGLDDEKASGQSKAAAQIITARIIEMVGADKKMTEKQIKEISQGLRDCTNIIVAAEKFRQGQLTQKVEAAANKIGEIATKKNIDPEILKQIKLEVYGIN